MAICASSWRSPAAGVRLFSRSICSALSSSWLAAVFSSTRATRLVPGIGAFGANSPAAYLAKTLPSKGAKLSNYYATGHLSLDNYISMVSGQAPNPQTQADGAAGFRDVVPGTIGADGQAMGTGVVYPPAVDTIANQLEKKGLTWKGYMEDMAN